MINKSLKYVKVDVVEEGVAILWVASDVTLSVPTVLWLGATDVSMLTSANQALVEPDNNAQICPAPFSASVICKQIRPYLIL